MRISIYLTISILFLTWACSGDESKDSLVNVDETNSSNPATTLSKIKVLNFGTFHMGYTTDANKTEFDEHNKENRKAVHQIAQQLAAFKPTVLLVENVPERNEVLQTEYEAYLKNPDTVYQETGEIRLLAFELGRLANTKRIYGIDHKMVYNYRIGQTLEENYIDSTLHNQFYKDPLAYYPQVNINMDTLSLSDKLKLYNHDQFLDFLITVNADALTFVGSENGFEGADEAARYYQRNLRMFSNLNRIELDEEDRVFILMGASHTAFFRDFISRSPKYEMVNTFDYLK